MVQQTFARLPPEGTINSGAKSRHSVGAGKPGAHPGTVIDGSPAEPSRSSSSLHPPSDSGHTFLASAVVMCIKVLRCNLVAAELSDRTRGNLRTLDDVAILGGKTFRNGLFET